METADDTSHCTTKMIFKCDETHFRFAINISFFSIFCVFSYSLANAEGINPCLIYFFIDFTLGSKSVRSTLPTKYKRFTMICSPLTPLTHGYYSQSNFRIVKWSVGACTMQWTNKYVPRVPVYTPYLIAYTMLVRYGFYLRLYEKHSSSLFVSR